MWGIAGIFAYGNTVPSVDQAELLRIRERMVNRGLDGAGLWIDGDRRIGFAHHRLSIIDITDAGAQPMLDPDTGNRIVFNGEIDNDQALRDERHAAGARQYDATHHTQWVRRQDFAGRFDHLLDAMDQTTIDGVNSYFVCLAAQSAGLKVAFSGLGGYAHFRGLDKPPKLTCW